MCGLAGIHVSNTYSADNNPIPIHDYFNNYFESTFRLISHRGPDDNGSFYDEKHKIGFAHSRLSIQDISSDGHQPMVSSDGQVILVFNGEIYNFLELKNELLNKNIAFKGHSDTEVLLNLYLIHGEKILPMLNGVFAFAIWDKRDYSLFIARDGLGVKPLYYSVSDAGFLFASEIKVLFGLIPHADGLDYSALEKYLTFLWSPGDSTPSKSVKKLLPGEALLVKEGKIEKKWSWYNLPLFNKSKSNINTANEAIIGCQKCLREAVHRQMVADVPVGAFLSGGIDSSAVVTFAKEINPDIQCFTIDSAVGQEDGITDDLPYAKTVAKHLDVPLEIVTVDSNRLASDLVDMVAMLDEPLADPAPLNVLYISQIAREKGIKVLLSGAGGDDIFSGYRRHYALQIDRWLGLIPRSFRASIENFTILLNSSNTFFRRLAKLFNGSTLEGDERIINYFRWADQGLIQSLFKKEAREELHSSNSSNPMSDFLQLLPNDLSALDKMLALEQRFFLPDHNLTYTDKMSMVAGVEVRVPFLDLDLVEFAARIPMKYKQRGREGKWVLKKVMEPYLPHNVIYRPKTGFGVPLRRWMRSELRELLGDMLSEESIKKRGVFDFTAVDKLIKDNDTGVVDASYTLLSLMCIEIWCRQFVDGKFDYEKVYGDLNRG
jgi:asparagine synthase (glutamine-hydrolysing)